jgi:hypothetical protein
MTNQDLTKLEFLLTLEGNIIIQRFFNVKDFNPKAISCVELNECVKEICEEISYDLKMKTIEYLLENQNYYYDFDNVESETELAEEHFLLEVKQDSHVFISRIFPAHVYHPKVRFTVDIRPKIRGILANLTDVLSSREIETSDMGYELTLDRK